MTDTSSTTTLSELIDRYATWDAQRTQLAETEAAGRPPHADDWHASDDEAVELLRAVLPLLDVASTLASLDPSVWCDTASHFTCEEAEALADLLGAFYSPEIATTFIESHVAGDDDGDKAHGSRP